VTTGKGTRYVQEAPQRPVETLADLSEALAARPEAQAMFENLTSQNRFAVLHRLGAAKRQETRARRIEQYVDMLARGETFYPQRQRSDRG
jgi:uncharacterized protein YdeI (YjbR/CyaY-like superfamily)